MVRRVAPRPRVALRGLVRPAALPEGIIELPSSARTAIPLTLDAEHNLVYHERVFPTAPGTVEPGDDPASVAARQHYRLLPHASGRLRLPAFHRRDRPGCAEARPAAGVRATTDGCATLIEQDLIDGVRVDNLDGIAYPRAYLDRLREDLGPDRLIYAETMLAPLEPFDAGTASDGTTGYEQLAVVCAPFTSHAGLSELTELAEVTTGIAGDSTWMLLEQKKLKHEALAQHYSTEHARLAVTLAEAIGEGTPSITDLCTVTAEMIALMPVSRPDQHVGSGLIAEIGELVADADPLVREAVPHVVEAIETAPPQPHSWDSSARRCTPALLRRTVLSQPRLVSLNELGLPGVASGCPNSRPSTTPTMRRAARFPRALTTLSTHDVARRGRHARVSMLSQVPQRWALLVNQLTRSRPAAGCHWGLPAEPLRPGRSTTTARSSPISSGVNGWRRTR